MHARIAYTQCTNANVQPIGHIGPASLLHSSSCLNVGMSWWDVCAAVVGVGVPLRDMSGVRVVLHWSGFGVGHSCARGMVVVHQNSDSDRE